MGITEGVQALIYPSSGLDPTSKNPINALVSFFPEPDSPVFLDCVNFLLTTLPFKEAIVITVKRLD